MEKPSKVIIADKHGTYKGFDYLVLNARNTHYCAYIRIPESHPFYRMPYLSIDLNCHGGLTFGEMTSFENVRVMEWDSRFYGFFWPRLCLLPELGFLILAQSRREPCKVLSMREDDSNAVVFV